MGGRKYTGLSAEESGRGRKRSSGGGPAEAWRAADNWTRATWGLGLFFTILLAGAIVMGAFGVAAYYDVNHDVEGDIHNIKHEILNARHIPDRNTFTDDDDDGPDDDDDDDDDGDDDDSDWAIYNPVFGGFIEFIDGFDKKGNPQDGHVNFDKVPITVWEENIVVNGGQITSECTNDIREMTIAAGSPNIPVAAGIGASGVEAWLGFADYQEQRVITGTDSSSLSEARLSDTQSVMIYTDASDLLRFVLKEVQADGTSVVSSPVTLDATAYTFSGSCRFIVAPHATADFFVVAWQVADGSGGINAMLVEITDYAIPTANFSPVVTLVAGTDAKPNRLEYASSNNFVLGYAEDGVGAQLVTITADTVANTVAFNAPVLLSALFDDDCGVVSGGVREGGVEFVAVYGGNTLLSLTAEVFSISPAGVLASLAPGVVIYAPTTATFAAAPQSTTRLIVEIIDYDENVFGILQIFTQSGTSIIATPVATTVFSGHPGLPISTGLVALIEPQANLVIIDDTAVGVTYVSSIAMTGFPEVFQVWDVVVDGASVSWLPGDVEVFSEIDAVDLAVVVLTPTRVVVSYGDVVASPASNEIYTANTRITAFDAVSGRGNCFVQAKPTHPVGIALDAGVAGDVIRVLVSGCWTDSSLFDFEKIGDLCLHGDGLLRSNCFAIAGQEQDAVPRKIAHIRSQDTIVVQAPWTVDFP